MDAMSPSTLDLVSLRSAAEREWTGGRLRASLAVDDPARLLHELQIHQIELELQNAELLRANRELELVRYKFQALYGSAPVAYLTLDDQHCVVDCNAQAVTMFRLPLGRVLKCKIANCFDAGSVRPFNELIDQAERAGEASSDELMLSRALLGMPMYVSARARKLTLPDGSPQLMLLVLADISALKATREDMASMLMSGSTL